MLESKKTEVVSNVFFRYNRHFEIMFRQLKMLKAEKNLVDGLFNLRNRKRNLNNVGIKGIDNGTIISTFQTTLKKKQKD